MLFPLHRRVPRTKSVFERTSSRRYSSVDYDLNGFEENHRHSNDESNGQETNLVNHLHFLESILHPQSSDETFLPINGHDDLNNGIEDDYELDEYASHSSFSSPAHCCVEWRFSLLDAFVLISSMP